MVGDRRAGSRGRGADIGGWLEAWRQGTHGAPSPGSEHPQLDCILGCILGGPTGPWVLAAVGSWETESKGLWGPGSEGRG